MSKLRERLPTARVDWDAITGGPRSISSPRGFLCGPDGQGGGVSEETARTIVATEPHRASKAFVREHRELFGFGPEALDQARIQRDSVTPHNGLRSVVWEQRVDGIPVFEGVFVSHTTRRGELVSVSSHFVSEPERAADRGKAKATARRNEPILGARKAVALAARNAGESIEEDSLQSMNTAGAGAGTEQRQKYRAQRLSGETATQLVWLPINAATLRLCWDVVLTSKNRGEMFRLLVDAETGEVVVRRCLTEHISDATYRVFTGDSPSPFSPGHSSPSAQQPPVASRQLVTLSALDTNASPNGWINDGMNETFGNNVDAATDWNRDNEPDLPRPQGSPLRVFDFPIDLSDHPTNYNRAAVVQLFYWCNWVHDQFYRLGFTEAAGNFQVDNFGRGGLGDDPVEAEAQDAAGFSNANFSTPPDGLPGRMQMFLWNRAFPIRDGDFDAEVIIHEYTHGLSNRRVGGGVGIGAPQSRAMGEGWSDFIALSLLSQSGDDPGGVYPMGGYVSYLLGGHAQNYYFGIRRYPYCTDTNKSPLTFKDIDPTQLNPHLGVPMNPRFTFNTNTAGQVHNAGEVWCNTVWQVRANLINKHGFERGNWLAMQLVVDGMSLSPPNPTFLEARDAIILADRVNNEGLNHDELWAGFAKRGMGVSAICPPHETTIGVREAFDLPDLLWVTPLGDWTAKGRPGGPFDPRTRVFSLRNLGTSNISWSATTTAGWLSISPTSGTIATDSPPVAVTIAINEMASLLPLGSHSADIVFLNHSNGRARTNSLVLSIGAMDSLVQDFNTTRDNDLDFQTFTFTPDGSASGYSVCRTSATNFPVDPTGGTLFSYPPLGVIPEQVNLPPGKSVALFGTRWSSLYPSAEGSISFFSAADQFSPNTSLAAPYTLSGHFLIPRVSGMRLSYSDTRFGFSDAGSRTWKILNDRFVATFENITEAFTSNENSFQIELFYDGVIRITCLGVESRGGVIGLSQGGGDIPTGFVNSDFSSYPECLRLVVNTASNAVEGVGTILGQVIRPSADPTPLTVTLSSSVSSEASVPLSVTIPAGASNAPVNITIHDDAEQDGTQPCYITARAPGYADGAGVLFVHDNDRGMMRVDLPPTIAEGTNQTGSVILNSPASKNVFVTLSSLDTTELEVPPFVIVAPGQTTAVFSVRGVRDSQLDGPQTASILAQVRNWNSATGSTLVVDTDRSALFVDLPGQTSEAAGFLAAVGSVRISGTLSSNLVVSLQSSDPSRLTVPGFITIPAGQTSAPVDLTLIDNATLTGPQSVSVTAQRGGWDSGSDIVMIHDDETPSEPANPVPAHLAEGQSTNLMLSWRRGSGELILNGGFETGTFSNWTVRAWHPEEGGSVYLRFIIDDGTHDPRWDNSWYPVGAFRPFAGGYCASTELEHCNRGRTSISQDVFIPPNASSATLRWTDRIMNAVFEGAPQEPYSSNHFVRVEIRGTNDVLREILFETQPGFPFTNNWTTRSFSFARYIGETIRIVWLQGYKCGPLHLYLDEVSLQAPAPVPTVYDVYVGTEVLEYVGTTSEPSFPLSDLAPDTTYLWRVLARAGLASAASPVWQFRTREALAVDRFTWSPVSTQQFVGHTFATRLTAETFGGDLATSSTNPVTVRGSISLPMFPLLSDNFDDGEIGNWAIDPGHIYIPRSGSNTVAVTAANPARGSHCLTVIGGARIHRDGIVLDIPREQSRPDRVNFFIKASATNAAGGFVRLAEPSRTYSPGITFSMNAAGLMGINQPLHGFIGIPYTPNRWYQVSVKFTWDLITLQHRFDFLIDDVLLATNLPLDSGMLRVNQIQVYNFDNTQVWLDELELIQGGLVRSVAVSPPVITDFAQGSWIGPITVHVPATNMWLTADDGAGHVGTSGQFSVLPATDSDGDGLPDEWEVGFFGAINAPQATADTDADGDGMTNLHEFQAGTLPNDAASALRVTAVRLRGSNVEIEFTSAAGKTYRLERSESVQGGTWSAVSNVVLGTGEIVRVNDAAAGNAANRFYRMRLAP